MLIRTIPIVLAAVAIIQAQPPGRGGRAGAGGARFLGFPPGLAGRTVTNAPFSADIVTETAQTLADGNRIRQTSTSKIYRDSEGRTRREQSLDSLNRLAPNSNLPQVVFISDPVTRTNYALNPSTKTGTRSVRIRPSGPERAGVPGLQPRIAAGQGRRANDPNVKTESLGRQLIEGVPADGTRTTMTIPVGRIGNEQPLQIVNETWYSPELQTTVLSKRSDPRHGDTTFKLTNISRTEPPRTLFEVPVDYTLSEMARPRAGRGLRQ